jgi:predicted nucleotidyltransferase
MSKITPYGIPESDLDALISELKRNSRIHEILLFGSRAKGTFKNGSDIDIALKGNNLNLRDILDAISEIEKLLLPNKLDLVIFDRINEPALVDHINRAGIVLFKRTGTEEGNRE